jgi:hypothetical protein
VKIRYRDSRQNNNNKIWEKKERKSEKYFKKEHKPAVMADVKYNNTATTTMM